MAEKVVKQDMLEIGPETSDSENQINMANTGPGIAIDAPGTAKAKPIRSRAEKKE